VLRNRALEESEGLKKEKRKKKGRMGKTAKGNSKEKRED
jgi:hypothetical protein